MPAAPRWAVPGLAGPPGYCIHQGPNDHLAASLRYEGFVEALKAAGLGREPWTASGDFNFKSGVEAAESLLAQGKSFTALACANDDMAAGAMFALHRARKTIPGTSRSPASTIRRCRKSCGRR
ncbi:substrate-binding domain-containing protein [Sphingomonas daechungensis]|uniref:Substrate-binding domain-containing protein n=1 Tax=Sphingomonas daechungensis TaxID=1176646 RepID=A0ABX6T2Y2_9SPHN|nr:substrate-binding domain-containing protein [Sphingomonas daechungensis]